MNDQDIDWVLWAGTVGLESPVEPRIDAAVAGGYSYLTVSPLDIARLADTGGPTASELGKRIRDAGLNVIVDPVMNWYPGGGPPRSRFAGFTPDESLRVCADLGAISFSAIATGHSDFPPAELAGPFGALCDRAADLGLLVHLEFIPMTVVANLAIALEIVISADRPNGGIVFDTWHFFRGDPDFDVLSGAPGDRIFAVQIDDAYEQVSGTLWEDTQHRLGPGQGSLDLVRAVRALAEIGGLRRIGAEIISPEWAAMPMNEAAASAAELTRTVVAAAL